MFCVIPGVAQKPIACRRSAQVNDFLFSIPSPCPFDSPHPCGSPFGQHMLSKIAPGNFVPEGEGTLR